MNKTVTINISGLFFHIDEDAYNKLSNYLVAIKKSLNTEGKEEIINDIESRIAEIFSEKINPSTGVISMIDVDNIIKMMGQPEDYRLDDEDAEYVNEEQKSDFESYPKGIKKLFRDGDRRVLGGVLAGFSNYCNVDVVWIRIIFILLTFVYGMSIIIYPILWIIIPKAKSVSDILEMKGEPVNISNIEKQVRENINHIGNNIKNMDTKRLKDVSSTIINILLKIVGISCLIIGFFGIMGSFIMMFALNTISNSNFINIPILELVEIGYPNWVVITSLFLMAFIPSLVIFIMGLNCIYKNIKYVGLITITLGFIWVASIVFFTAVMFQLESKKDFLNNIINENMKVTVVKKSLDHLKNDTINIDFLRDPRFYGMNDTLSRQEAFEEEENVSLDIKTTTSENPYFEIVTKASYSKNSTALINNKSGSITTDEIPSMLEYYSNINNNTLEFADAVLNKKNKAESFINSVKITLYLPKNKIVRINGNNKQYFNYINIIEPGVNHYKLKDEYLDCMDCN